MLAPSSWEFAIPVVRTAVVVQNDCIHDRLGDERRQFRQQSQPSRARFSHALAAAPINNERIIA